MCDAPARQFLKNIRSHNSYHGCERCTVKGVWEGRVVFDGELCELRSEEKFNAIDYEDHQNGPCPFVTAGVLCIKNFLIEYMHLVCLGVVKRMLLWLIEGPRLCRLSQLQQQQISDRLNSIRGKMPSEFARQPRGLQEVKRWKATEFRQFLLYSGPIVLKGKLSKSYYQHFLSLSTSITILCYPAQESRPMELLNYAEKLLIWFVREAKALYGTAFLSYNVHNLIHLVSDVRYHRCSLDGISAFPFENYLQILKKYVRNSNKPLVQIVKRIAELERAGTSHSQKHVLTKVKVDGRNCFFI